MWRFALGGALIGLGTGALSSALLRYAGRPARAMTMVVVATALGALAGRSAAPSRVVEPAPAASSAPSASASNPAPPAPSVLPGDTGPKLLRALAPLRLGQPVKGAFVLENIVIGARSVRIDLRGPERVVAIALTAEGDATLGKSSSFAIGLDPTTKLTAAERAAADVLARTIEAGDRGDFWTAPGR